MEQETEHQDDPSEYTIVEIVIDKNGEQVGNSKEENNEVLANLTCKQALKKRRVNPHPVKFTYQCKTKPQEENVGLQGKFVKYPTGAQGNTYLVSQQKSRANKTKLVSFTNNNKITYKDTEVESETGVNSVEGEIVENNFTTDHSLQEKDSSSTDSIIETEEDSAQSLIMGNDKMKEGSEPSTTKPKENSDSNKMTDNIKPRLSLNSLQTELRSSVEKLSNDMQRGFDNITNSLTDPELGLVPRFNRLEKKIMDPEEGVLKRLQDVETKADEAESAQLEFRSSLENMEMWVSTIDEMAGIIEKHEKEIASLKNQAIINTARNMERNLLIGGITETMHENLKMKITHFLREKVKVTFENKDVITVKRVGGRRMITNAEGERVKAPKLVLVKCTTYLKNRIMKNVYHLAGESDPETHIKYFISQHIPEAFREARSKYKKEIDRVKEENKSKQPKDRVPVRLTSGKLYVNNKLFKDEVTPPTAREILRITPNIQKKLDEVDLLETKTITDQDNEFKAYAAFVSNVEEINTAYLKVRQSNAAADHVSIGYTYRSSKGDILLDGCNDFEHGCASRIMRKIKYSKYTNIAIFMVRYYSGAHLGGDRFKHIDELIEEALKKIDDTQSTDSEPEGSHHADDTESKGPGLPRRHRKKKRSKHSPKCSETESETLNSGASAHPDESSQDDEENFNSLPEDN